MEKYAICQGDRFSSHFEISKHKTKEDAEKELKRIEQESLKYDCFTCFYIKKICNENN